MRHPSLTTMPSSSSSTATASKPRKATTSTTHSSSSSLHHHHHSSTSSLFCRHHSPSATATLDLLILILVLISGTFLLTSYFSYLFTSLSLLLPHTAAVFPTLPPLSYALGAVLSFSFLTFFALCRRGKVRKCGNPNCKGLKKALEFDLQLQTEDCLKTHLTNSNNNSTHITTNTTTTTHFVAGSGGHGGGHDVKITNGNNSQLVGVDIEKLPWKGGTETNPDYECLRAELRKMAPPNGRAVLLFRAKCGCPVAKLVGWGPKKGRKHKKALASTAANSDHR